MKKYEYKIVIGSQGLNRDEDERLLNNLGNESWELVATESTKMKMRDGIFADPRQVYWLKREI